MLADAAAEAVDARTVQFLLQKTCPEEGGEGGGGGEEERGGEAAGGEARGEDEAAQ